MVIKDEKWVYKENPPKMVNREKNVSILSKPRQKKVIRDKKKYFVNPSKMRDETNESVMRRIVISDEKSIYHGNPKKNSQ